MRWLITFLFLCAATLSLSPVPSLGAAELKTTDVAVLRLDEAIRNSKTYLARVEMLKKEKAEAEGILKQMEEQMQALDGKLQAFNPSSDKFAQAQEEMEVLKVKRELLAKRTRSTLDRRHGAALKEAFDVLRKHLAAFAKERSLRMVTLAPNPDMPPLSSNDMQMQLGLQTALYYDPSLDITEAFIAFANSRFANDGAAHSSAPAPTPAPTPAPSAATP
jgi:Skp family chaperone for outer membrane proteins